ncbi:hypothetical protein JW905_16370, partial [bacterium]|nr:hypothetical protein [candidate division CSSED10-310 bacterium]
LRLPGGMSQDAYDRLAAALAATGATIILDATGVIADLDLHIADHGIPGVYFDTSELPGGWHAHPVLILREDTFRTTLPLDVGGGIVYWTTAENHRYIGDRTALEDAGTPGIIQGIRSGLVIGSLRHAVSRTSRAGAPDCPPA